ncbi:hypothetical protein J4416_04135 [Candidatus Pacearchaeota archaeon]|nr:hypothetical protein [Candidatus Pacearchaeota archaeon]
MRLWYENYFGNEGCNLKKYLLLIEDEKLWARFKETIDKDINTAIIELVKEKTNRGVKHG